MAYGIPQLRRQSIMSGYGFEPMNEMSGYDPSMDDPGYDPTYDPGGYNVGEILSPYMGRSTPQAPPVSPSTGTTPLSVPTYKPTSMQDDWNTVNQMYTPETVDRDRLRALMDAAPERERSSFARSLVAAGLSLKAADPVATSEAIMTAPHRRNMADWLAKSEPFYKTAELENRANVNERTLIGNMVTANSQARRLEENARQADQKNEVARTKAEADMIRARAYELKNNGWKFDFSGPRVIGIGPNNQRMDLGETGKMDERTKIDLQGEWGVKRAEAYGQAAADRVAMAGADWARDPDGNWHVVNPRTIPPTVPPQGSKPISTSGEREDTPANAAKRQEMDWTEKYYTHPERDLIHKWTTIKNGKVVLKPQPTMGSWLQSDEADQRDIDEYNRVTRILYDKEVPTTQAPPPRVTPPGASNKGLGPSPNMTVPTVKKPEEQPRSWKDPKTGARMFRPVESIPSGSYMENGVRKFYGQEQRKTDINLPLAGSPQNPAKTEDEMMEYAALQQRAAEFVRSQGKPVTQEYIDFAIRKGWVR